MKLTDIYSIIKEEMSDEDDTTKIFSRLRKQLNPNYTDKIDKPVVKPNIVYVDLDKEIIDGTTGKPIISYILPKNEDGSYNVIYNDATTGVIYVSNDAWDEINNLARQSMNEDKIKLNEITMKKQILNEEFKRMQKLAGIINENQINEVEVDKEKLMPIFDEVFNDKIQDYSSLVGTDPIYDGLNNVIKNPSVKQAIFDWAYSLTTEDEDDEEEVIDMFGGYVSDGVDYEIMRTFAPQLAKNLIKAGFTYDKDEDIWTIPQPYLDKIDSPFNYSDGATSYGIIWDVWGVDYDTSPRENIGSYLEDAAQEL
jgi:hypothetical protein